MMVPPLDDLSSQKINVNGKLRPALELKMKPGYYSDPSNLTFSYNISAMTPRTITLQISFDFPNLISSLDDPEKLEVYFNGYFFFFSQYGKTVDPGTMLVQNIPKQFSAGGLTSQMAAAAASLSSTTNAVMAGNMAMNIILSASLQ